MTAAYPGLTPALTPKTDLTSIVMAVDVNAINDEVISIGTTVGLNPQNRGSNWGTGVAGGGTVSGSFTTSSLLYTTVGQRILNVENGTYLVYNDYISSTVSGTSGNIITPAGTTTVNLTLKAQTSQTANLLEAKNSAGTAVVTVGPTGTLQAVLIDGGTA